ncbi:MAG: DUF2829 domain-containing protein [Proteobacteria bacterium]|nr:DUF2829 domain-containing protein [Pseudomonadota bacterium]
MDFGDAIRALKQGKRVARKGWNGKGMWLALFQPNGSQKTGNFGYPTLPFILMKTVDNKIVPWLASQTDMLAEDWGLVEDVPQAAPAVLSRAALAIVSEAVQSYLAQLENREPPPDQSPVDVIQAASQHVMAQRGIAVPSDLREVCTQVLQHYLRKEVR